MTGVSIRTSYCLWIAEGLRALATRENKDLKSKMQLVRLDWEQVADQCLAQQGVKLGKASKTVSARDREAYHEGKEDSKRLMSGENDLRS